MVTYTVGYGPKYGSTRAGRCLRPSKAGEWLRPRRFESLNERPRLREDRASPPELTAGLLFLALQILILALAAALPVADPALRGPLG